MLKQDEGKSRKKVTSEGCILEVKLPGIQPYEPDDRGRRRWDICNTQIIRRFRNMMDAAPSIVGVRAIVYVKGYTRKRNDRSSQQQNGRTRRTDQINPNRANRAAILTTSPSFRASDLRPRSACEQTICGRLPGNGRCVRTSIICRQTTHEHPRWVYEQFTNALWLRGPISAEQLNIALGFAITGAWIASYRTNTQLELPASDACLSNPIIKSILPPLLLPAVYIMHGGSLPPPPSV